MNEIYSEKKIFIAVLNCPYINWENLQTQSIFSKMISLKIKGYSRKHYFGVLPIDQTDFLATHLLICTKDEDEKISVLSGVKTLPLDVCSFFKVDFTPEFFFKKSAQLTQLAYTKKIMANSVLKKTRISYYSSWTQHPDIRSDYSLVAILKEIFAAMTVHFHRQESISDLLGLGLPKFKTDQFFMNWGFERAMLNGIEIPNSPLQFLANIDCVLMHLKKFSPYAEELAIKHQDLWNSRLTIGTPLISQEVPDYIKKTA